MTEEFLNVSVESSEFDNEEIYSPQSSEGSRGHFHKKS
jgi:hypothetical protein